MTTGGPEGSTTPSVGEAVSNGASVGAAVSTRTFVGAEVSGAGGMRTVSISWITPFDTIISGTVMVASLILAGFNDMVVLLPWTISTMAPSTKSVDNTRSDTT